MEIDVVARPMEWLHHSRRSFEVSADSFQGKPVLTAGPCHVLADAVGRKQEIKLAATARNRRASLSSISATSIVIALVADTRGADTDLHVTNSNSEMVLSACR